ncbi:MAG: TRAM domain-containing protein, partial [Oscillospiraceae bacterium]|nr:TRAM domain-containing protein [Oscillospiraceae bacterium]
DIVPNEVKSEWFTEMLGVLDEVGAGAYERYVGKTLRILCEGASRTGERDFSGKRREGIIVDFRSASAGKISAVNKEDFIGEFVNVKVEKALKWAVLGNIIV